MILKYDIEVDKDTYNKNLKRLTNQIYKLLPMREESQEWDKFLNSIFLEIKGLNSLVGTREEFLPLISKLEALNAMEEFDMYRRTIFECLGLIGKMHG